MFHYHEFTIIWENQGWSSIFKFSAEISAGDVNYFKMNFSYFRYIGWMKFSKTLYARSTDPEIPMYLIFIN